MANPVYNQEGEKIEKDQIEEYRRKIADRVLISSFDLSLLQHLATLEKAPALGMISRNPADKQTLEKCKMLNAVSWHPNHQILTHDQVKKMNDASIKVFPYNADTPDEIDRMLLMEVDGVISSDPILVANRKLLVMD